MDTRIESRLVTNSFVSYLFLLSDGSCTKDEAKKGLQSYYEKNKKTKKFKLAGCWSRNWYYDTNTNSKVYFKGNYLFGEVQLSESDQNISNGVKNENEKKFTVETDLFLIHKDDPKILQKVKADFLDDWLLVASKITPKTMISTSTSSKNQQLNNVPKQFSLFSSMTPLPSRTPKMTFDTEDGRPREMTKEEIENRGKPMVVLSNSSNSVTQAVTSSSSSIGSGGTGSITQQNTVGNSDTATKLNTITNSNITKQQLNDQQQKDTVTTDGNMTDSAHQSGGNGSGSSSKQTSESHSESMNYSNIKQNLTGTPGGGVKAVGGPGPANFTTGSKKRKPQFGLGTGNVIPNNGNNSTVSGPGTGPAPTVGPVRLSESEGSSESIKVNPMDNMTKEQRTKFEENKRIAMEKRQLMLEKKKAAEKASNVK